WWSFLASFRLSFSPALCKRKCRARVEAKIVRRIVQFKERAHYSKHAPVTNCARVINRLNRAEDRAMHAEIFVDGVSEITVTGPIVRIDTYSLSPSERDADGNPKQ